MFRSNPREAPSGAAGEVAQSANDALRKGAKPWESEAAILSGSEGHKPMLIGKGGENLKRIGTIARKGLEHLLGCRVRLNLWVRVVPEWYNRPGQLRELGLGD